MKKVILFLLISISAAANANAQTLKELLYAGKLKKDSSGVIRKTDDLSSRIDTGQKKSVETVQSKTATVIADPVKQNSDSSWQQVVVEDVEVDSSSIEIAAAPANAPVKSSNRIWKDYTDSLVRDLKSEVLSSKKIKKDTYYLTVDYDVEPTGQVVITKVISSPENAFLQANIKDRMEIAPPQLSPVPKKIKRKYNFVVIKD